MNDVVAPVRSGIDFKADAYRDPWSVPLDEIDVSNPYLYSEDTWHGFFARLRRDDPVHFCDSPLYGPYWSVTRYRDIMTVDTSHQTYSSDAGFGGITLKDVPLPYRKESFIAMDPPRHDEQRKIVAPIVAPPNLAKMSDTIRERAIRILEGLPRGEVFDWVDRVSIELTTQMLSTLFDFPFEERRTLTRWSNVSTVNTRAGTEIDSEEKRDAVLQEMLAYFAEVWKIRQKAAAEIRPDLDAGARRGDARSAVAAAGVHGQPAAVDRRRQRHDAQLDQRRTVVPEPVPRGICKAARRSRLDPEDGAGDHPLPIAGRTHAPHRAQRYRVEREAHRQGRQGGDVVHRGQPRSRRDRGPGPFHHRPRAAASAFVVRVRHSPLRRQPAGGDAADDPVGGDPEALPADRGCGETEASLLKPDPRHHRDESAIPAKPACARRTCRASRRRSRSPRAYDRMVAFEVSIAILNHIAAPRAAQQLRPLAGLREAGRVDRAGPRVPQGYREVKTPSARFAPIRELGAQPRLPAPPQTTPSRRNRLFKGADAEVRYGCFQNSSAVRRAGYPCKSFRPS